MSAAGILQPVCDCGLLAGGVLRRLASDNAFVRELTLRRPSRYTLEVTFLNSAAGSLLGNSDRGEPQHHLACESEMDAVEPPDCAAPVEVGNGKCTFNCYSHPRHRLHSTYDLKASTSRGHSTFRYFLIGDDSPCACIRNRIELGAEVGVCHGTFPRFEAGCTRLYACDLGSPYDGGTACKTPRSGRANSREFHSKDSLTQSHC